MIGSSIAQYRIETQLGSGGMGVVYRAYDSKLRRRAAIKFLNGVPDDESRARLLQEARAADSSGYGGSEDPPLRSLLVEAGLQTRLEWRFRPV